ncbi:TPA_asm: G [Chrysanthemum alphacytorhabdovirus 1]|nr:TPA_asm: G [Chrysanthemum alphacytorhabdovirus 1]
MLHLILISLVILCTRCSGAGFFNATIGPYAICEDKAANVETMLQTCYERCRKPPQPKHSYMVTVHQSDVKNGGPVVVECRKVTIEQTFTKTWLFSTVASEPRSSSSPASEGECAETISRMCPSMDCHVREPHNLDGEYHYASDTVITKTFITAMSMPSSLTTEGSEIRVMPLSSERSFPLSARRGSSSVGTYIWKDTTISDSCPFTPATKYGCDYYDDRPEDKHMVCARGGFALTMWKYIADIYPKCEHLMISKEGIIYNFSDSDNLQRYSQRVGLTNLQYKTEDTESFRSKMNHILSNMDSDMCMMQCEVLSLEARIKRDSAKLLKIGSDIILLEPNGTGIACRPAYGCRLAKPHSICGGPPRIGLECTGVSGYWNPTLPYLTTASECAAPKPSEKMIITAGHHQYTLDDNLVSLVPSGFMHGRPNDIFSSDHMEGLQFEKEDLDELRATWVGSKTESVTNTRETASDTQINSPTLTGNILNWPGKIAHYLAHQLKEVMILCGIILMLVISSIIIWRSLNDRGRAIPRAQMVPLMEIPREAQPVARWI